MNRSILIVICDFLLVSLLAFSTVDINQVAQEGNARPMQMQLAATNHANAADKDLSAVMQLALEEERANRDRLLGELNQIRLTAGEQQALLSEREKQLQAFQQQLQVREQQASRLEQQRSALEQQRTALEQQRSALQDQFIAAQTNIQRLNERLLNTSSEASVTRERLAEIEAEARKHSEQAAALQERLAALARTNEMILNERQRLATQLQVTEVEKRHAEEQAARLSQEVQVQREEKAQLAEGVKALANRSGELVQEIRESRPLAPNTIFSQFLSNRVTARFTAVRPGPFGNEAARTEQTETILVTDGTNIFAICHVQDTPLSFGSPGVEWQSLSGTLLRQEKQVPVQALSFAWTDPRLAWVPLSSDQARQLGSEPYQISTDPFKFQDAVLVGTREGYYGECRFQIDPTAPNYVQLDRSFIRGLFGKFNPSRGDLVFSKTGELLGIMVNGGYAVMLQRFDPIATFRFSQDVRAQHTGETLAALHAQVNRLPAKLQ